MKIIRLEKAASREPLLEKQIAECKEFIERNGFARGRTPMTGTIGATSCSSSDRAGRVETDFGQTDFDQFGPN